MTVRASFPKFILANDAYIAATLSLYTVDGNPPSAVDGGAGNLVPEGATQEGVSPLHILIGPEIGPGMEGTVNLQYFAVDCFGSRERVRSETYKIDRRPPVTSATPAGGTYNVSQTVTLQTDEVATIYYTIDGSVPSSNPDDQIVYGGNTYRREQIAYVNISNDLVVTFFSIDLAGNVEAVKTEDYVIR